jgi:hypothetical protein
LVAKVLGEAKASGDQGWRIGEIVAASDGGPEVEYVD